MIRSYGNDNIGDVKMGWTRRNNMNRIMVSALIIVCLFISGCSSGDSRTNVKDEDIEVFDKIEREIQTDKIVMLDYDSIKCGDESIEYDTEGKFKYLSGSISMPLDSDYLGDVGLEVFDENREMIGYTQKVYADSETVHFCMDVENVKKITIMSSEVNEEHVVLEVFNLRLTTEEYGNMNADNYPEELVADSDLKIENDYQPHESRFINEESVSKGSTEDCSYVEFDEGIQLLQWKSDKEIVVIPNTIVGKPVLEIAERAFSATKAKEIMIPSSVEFIGNRAFISGNLQSVKLEEGLKYIGEEAFGGCYNLEEVYFPSSLIYIGEKAFYECTSLKTALLPSELQTIGEAAFAKCEKLISEVVIPGAITVIPNELYASCKQITNIRLHDGIRKLGAECFANTSIRSIQIPEGVRELANGCLAGCENLEQITLPASLHIIGESVFSGDSALKEIALPESLLEIGNGAFVMCDGLKELKIPKTVKDIGNLSGVFPIDTTLIVYKDSYAYQYAQSHGCNFQITE